MHIFKKKFFFIKNMYATIFNFIHNLIYQKGSRKIPPEKIPTHQTPPPENSHPENSHLEYSHPFH